MMDYIIGKIDHIKLVVGSLYKNLDCNPKKIPTA